MGTRGFYDIFSGDRNKPTYGHYSVQVGTQAGCGGAFPSRMTGLTTTRNTTPCVPGPEQGPFRTLLTLRPHSKGEIWRPVSDQET